MQPRAVLEIEVAHPSDVGAARRQVRAAVAGVDFDDQTSDEVALVATELASNLLRHAGGGALRVTALEDGARAGVRVETEDRGPGIADVGQALADGFSTQGSLGCGLGAVHRLMDELSITPRPGGGTSVVCTRWARPEAPRDRACPLAIGVATRPHPRMGGVNGDAFVVCHWQQSALVGVVDGLGHGQWAHRASQTARRYLETHFEQPLGDLFREVGRACRPTRGVVMALARFDWAAGELSFAGVGNVEARVVGSSEPFSFVVRRGVVGLNAPAAAVTRHRWDPRNILVLHSDGLRSHWRWEDFPELADESAAAISQRLLRRLARDEDDATVVVVKEKKR